MFFGSEAKSLMRLALPIAMSQLIIIGMGITDVIVAGRAGTVELAGMTLGSNVTHIIIYSFFAIGFAAAPLVSRHFGAGRLNQMASQIQQVLWTCVLVGIFCMVFIYCASQLLSRANFDPEIQRIATSYTAVMSLSGFVLCMVAGLRSSLESMTWTVPVLIVNLLAFLINIPLDIILVHGYLGAPRLGSVGCAVATVAIQSFIMLSFFVCLWLALKKQKITLSDHFETANKSEIIKIIKLGFPMGLSVLIEMGFFSGAAVMIVYFGAINAGAHAVAIAAASATYMIYHGLSQAITIRASHHLGRDHYQQARDTCQTGIKIGVVVSLVCSAIFILFRHEIVTLFSNDPDVIALAATLLVFAAIVQFADAMQVTALYGLRAYLDTKSPVIIQFIGFWIIAAPMGYLLSKNSAYPMLNGAFGYWTAMCVGLGIVAIILMKKLVTTARDYPHGSTAQVKL